jgi:undecaprenyl-diphosphatase
MLEPSRRSGFRSTTIHWTQTLPFRTVFSEQSRARLWHWVNTSFEFRALLMVLGIAIAALVFIDLAGEIAEGDTLAFDRTILLALRDPANHLQPIGPNWLRTVALDITALGGPVILSLLTASIAGYLMVIRKPGASALVALSIISGMLLSTFLKDSFDRPRPELVPHIVVATSGSFPSGHAMLSAVTYLTLAGLLMRIQPGRAAKSYVLGTAILLTVMIGASRIYLGVHWPTDVVAGWCVGAAWALLCWLISVWLQIKTSKTLA